VGKGCAAGNTLADRGCTHSFLGTVVASCPDDSTVFLEKSQLAQRRKKGVGESRLYFRKKTTVCILLSFASAAKNSPDRCIRPFQPKLRGF